MPAHPVTDPPRREHPGEQDLAHSPEVVNRCRRGADVNWPAMPVGGDSGHGQAEKNEWEPGRVIEVLMRENDQSDAGNINRSFPQGMPYLGPSGSVHKDHGAIRQGNRRASTPTRWVTSTPGPQEGHLHD